MISRKALARLALLGVLVMMASATATTTYGQTPPGKSVTATYAAPKAANQWEQFTIPLTAAAFKTDDATFREVMKNVQRFRIFLEFSGAKDTGGMDNVSIGTRFASSFGTGTEGWSAGGDGTLGWKVSGGVAGGFLEIVDWQRGDDFWATAPVSWSGDWSNLIGSSLVFSVRTTNPDGPSLGVDISNIAEKRMVLSADPFRVVPGGSSTVSVTLTQPTAQNLAVALKTSDKNCMAVPTSVTVNASQPKAQFTATAPAAAVKDCSAVIEATGPGYGGALLTLTVGALGEVPTPSFGDPEPASGVPGMTLQAGQRRVVAGGLVLVPIWLIKGANVANVNYDVTYNAAVARPEGTIAKGNLLGSALLSANPSQSGLIRVGFAQSAGLSGTGTVAYVPFRAVGKAGDRTALALAVTTINDPSGTTLTISRIPGEILIVGADGLVPGDCNGDGRLDAVDALCALEISVGSRPVTSTLDMDKKDGVTSRDATIILQTIVKR